MEYTGILKSERRAKTNTRANRRLRKTGYLPGVIYAKGIDSVPVTVKKDELRKIFVEYGRNAIFKLEIENEEPHTVMVQKMQYAPVTGEVEHVDFQQVSLSEKIRADVVVRFLGEENIEAQRMLVMRQLDTIAVKGLPQDIPDTIDVDVKNLKLGDRICVGDIKYQKGIVPETEPDTPVVIIGESKVSAAAKNTEEQEESLSVSV